MKSHFASRPMAHSAGSHRGTGGALLDDVRPSLEMTFRGHRQSVLGVDMQPIDAHTISRGLDQTHTLPPKTVSCSADGSILLWDAKPTTRALRLVGHRGPVMGCAFSPKALVVASCGHDGYVRLWVPDLRRSTSSFPGQRVLTQGVSSSSASRHAKAGLSSSSLAEAEADGSVAFKAHSSGAARALAFAKDGSDVLYTVGDDKGVKAWDLNYVAAGASSLVGEYGHSSGSGSGGSSRFVGSFLGGHTNWVRCVTVQESAHAASHTPYLATGGDDATVVLWDTRSRQVAHQFGEHDGGIRSLAFHPGGYQVASGDVNSVINVYDVRRASSSSSPSASSYGLVQHYRNAHGSTGSAVNGLDFCPKGHWLLSAGDDAVVKLWDTLEGYLYCAVEAHNGPVRACRFSGDGQFFTTGGADKIVMVWRAGLPGRCVANTTTTTTATTAARPLPSAQARTPVWSSALETGSSRLAKTRYAHDERRDAAMAEAEQAAMRATPPPPPPPAPVMTRTQSPPRDRSFERDEARHSHLGETHAPWTAAAPHAERLTSSSIQEQEEQEEQEDGAEEGCANEVASAAQNSSSGQPRRVRFSEDAQTSHADAQDASSAMAPPHEQQELRIENLERAVAMLGQQVRTALLTQQHATQTLREEWQQSEVRHRDDVQKLMAMMAQLVQQQTILVAQQQEQRGAQPSL